MSKKFPIGSRVSGRLHEGPRDVPMKVLGYDGLKYVIVEILEDVDVWAKGRVTLVQAKSLTLREEVKHITGEPEDGDGAAIGWMELGGLSVGLTRSERDGTLLVSLETAPSQEDPVRVRIIPAHETNGDIWEGEVT